MRANQKVAWNLRRLRVGQGIAQETLAVDASVDRTYISRLERNLENPTVAVLERLAQALQVPIAELFSEMAAKPPPPLRSGRRPALKRHRKSR